MTKREKLQLLMTGKTPKMLEGFKTFDTGIAELKKNLEENIRVSTLDEVSGKINDLKKKVDFSKIEKAITELKQQIEDSDKQEKQELDTRLATLKTDLTNADSSNANGIKSIQEEIDGIHTQIADVLSRKPIEIPDFAKQIRDAEMRTRDALETYKQEDADEDEKEAKEWKKQFTDINSTIDKFRGELLSRINQGGGNMNRQIYIGGVDFLKKYTDYNIKAGTNVTITYTNNDTTKKVDVTFSATGGGGGSVRSINSISTSQIAGSASGTDYVYLCTGTLTLTMPDATAGNTNLYTVKNVGSGVVTINTTSAQTIDGSSTIVMPVQFTSVDLISDTANWVIT